MRIQVSPYRNMRTSVEATSAACIRKLDTSLPYKRIDVLKKCFSLRVILHSCKKIATDFRKVVGVISHRNRFKIIQPLT